MNTSKMKINQPIYLSPCKCRRVSLPFFDEEEV